jgi:signal transduction histidine kinase
MTSPSRVATPQRHAGTWISVIGVLAYVLASPLLLGSSLEDSLWWVAAGAGATGLVALGAMMSARASREHIHEVYRLDDEARDLAGICETRRLAMENLVEAQLPALTKGTAQPPLADAAGDEATAALLTRAAAHLSRVREDQRARQDAVQAAVVTLGRKVQASAHRIQEEAARMVQRHPTDADVLHTSMRVDHAAAQQARNAQSLAALCGEWPGQQWHQPLPIADVVRGAAGRITAYQRVEVSGDPGVAVAARVVEPLIHVIAELLANATQSSPPTTQVLVSLRHVQRGAVVEIDDGGVGLDDVRLEQVREIASGRRSVSLADLGEIPQTGLPVVGAYVRRHGFRVDVTESVYGGLRAIVLVPAELTEPVAPSGVIAGHALTRRQDSASPALPGGDSDVAATHPLDEPPAPREPEPATARTTTKPSQEPGPRPGTPRPDPTDLGPITQDLPVLPRRRSRRAEAMAGTVDWPAAEHSEEHGRFRETTQSAEEAGQWMGAFLSTAGRAENSSASTPANHQNHQDTEER